MIIKEITNYLESLAPLDTQESYDNCGLIVGDYNTEVTGVLVALDCIESIVEEAIQKGCNLVIAHHPIVFKGLKKLNGKNYIERTVLKAIKNDVAIYAIHTNFDNYRLGVNKEIGERLGLVNTKILAPKSNTLVKLVYYVPVEHADQVKEAIFATGAGQIGDYSECSFQTNGVGTFMPINGATPFLGTTGERESVEELKVEILVVRSILFKAISAMKLAHPYEEVAHEIFALENDNQYSGAGLIGELENEMSEVEFLTSLKTKFKCGIIRHTSLINKPIKKVALCGGSGSFLLGDAMRAKADIFITGDFKYHEFFDSDNQIVIADIGHYESEQYTSDRLVRILKEKFANFAVHLTEVNTNPINYF